MSSSDSSRTGSSGKETSGSLLERVRAHDDEAWERLLALYAPLVWYWCRQHPCHRSGQLDEADLADVFQEVFQVVSTKLDRFEKTRPGDTFRGWLRTVTRNKTYDHARALAKEPRGVGGSSIQRRLSSTPEPLVEPEDETQSDPAESQLFRQALDQIREHFRPHTWQAFWRTTVDGQPAVEVARELDMTPGAVRVAKSRVLHRLRLELGDTL